MDTEITDLVRADEALMRPAPTQAQRVSFGAVSLEQLETLMRLAKAIANSSMVPDAYRGRPDDVLAVTLAGAELGLGVMQSLRDVTMVKGKATIAYSAMLGMILRAGYMAEWDDTVDQNRMAVLHLTSPRGIHHTEEFTWEMAEARGLARNQNWQKMPKVMLQARCVSAAARAFAADAIGGSVYVHGELEEAGAARITPSGVQEERPLDASELKARGMDSGTAHRLAAQNQSDLARVEELIPEVSAIMDIPAFDAWLWRRGHEFRTSLKDPAARNILWGKMKEVIDALNGIVRTQAKADGVKPVLYTRDMISTVIAAAEQDGLTPQERADGVAPEESEEDEVDVDMSPAWMR